ncbi:hypothetical protein ASPZODRAFT_118173 [Penicilliopsis zonata CBS 506.65]|uniref:Mechanosensitive ion channel protein n=1 Tax=Penicilliopsis zonata CBS 506.65 TaxID=1073090 RepID=A0A1L9SGB5_9EURO|nr:hypothetical protein ASPZODRAFT_118173 [Penicilliopsis zonata CBS 506.65]OJJ46211.1 hypothetical protein ASPZODRAFT_118173 [Penicilliopsis zonata CBS 506.65]
MSTPVTEFPSLDVHPDERTARHGGDSTSPTSENDTVTNENSPEDDNDYSRPKVDTDYHDSHEDTIRSPSQAREQAMRLEDDLALLQAERVASRSTHEENDDSRSYGESISRARSQPAIDEFDEATNPLHEKAAIYNPPENPNTNLSKFVKRIHNSSFLVRYATYITPLVVLLLIPLLLGALVYPRANVGGVHLLWFSIWLEIVWLTLWAGRIVSKCIPAIVSLFASIFTNNAKKWRDLAKQLELHAALFFWWLSVEISFLPIMRNHRVPGSGSPGSWETTLNKIIIVIFVWTILNLIEKFIIQLIAMSFHMRTYADRIEINKFQIGSLTKLYAFSKDRIAMADEEFEERGEKPASGVRTPLQYAGRAQKVAKGALNKVGDVAGAVAADFTGRKVNKSSHPYQVILALLATTSGSQVLARRLYRTFVRHGFDTVFSGDLKEAFDNNDEAEAAFIMFDKDMNGDISMEELESVCVEIGRERKSITASLKDLDSVVSKLDDVFAFIVLIITLIVFLSLISTSTAGVLTSAGSSILALSWLFSATAQEFLQSVIFVFVKHPFDVGDRVTVYGNSGDSGLGDDYFVKQISLLYTEFKKMQGHVVQAPNSYLNGLFILNQRRSGALAEAIPIVIRYGTTLEQIDALRQRLLEFVRSEKREYQSNILTELRAVTENFSLTLNVVFFYKSNWQNEGLRLQRRNKFICMLMIALQEIGIEGPRMNLQGAKVDIPFHVSYFGNNNNQQHHPGNGFHDARSPITPIHSDTPTIPETTTATSSGVLRQQPSILRKGMNTVAARARGESTSHKHVDFSLGMRDLASDDVMGDVFDDRRGNNHSGGSANRIRIDEVVRSANRESAERRIQEAKEEEEEAAAAAAAEEAHHRISFSSSRRHSHLSSGGASSSRRSVDSQPRRSGSTSIHHNRFFRTRHHRATPGRADDDHNLMEQGRASLESTGDATGRAMDPRTGMVSPAAIQDD